jgi:L-glutamine-phosphate cytidylyltransferase
VENKKPKVILLVAGEGKRLRPYTLDCPKCMVEIDGISLIDRQISVLHAESLYDIVMIGGYKAQMLKKFGTKLKINPDYSKTNMLWTLFCAEEELEGDVIVSYGDIVYSREILQELLKSTADISVVIDKGWKSYWQARSEDPLDDAETLKLRADGVIMEIGQLPKTLEEIEGQYIGLMKFSAKGVRQIKQIFRDAVKTSELLGKPLENSYMTDLLQATINKGFLVTSVPICGEWIEVDEVSDMDLQLTHDRLNSIQRSLDS